MQDNVLKVAQLPRGDYFFILTDDDRLAPGALQRSPQRSASIPKRAICSAIYRPWTNAQGR